MMTDMEEAAAVPGGPMEHPLSPVEVAEVAEVAEVTEVTEEDVTAPEEKRAPRVAAVFLPDPETTLPLFKMKRFLVLRPGTLNQAIADVTLLVNKQTDGGVLGVWLLAEVDHWNNEKERLVMVTQNSLLVFKYDFLMFNCEQLQRIPLHFIDRIVHGDFRFPKFSLLRRDGDGVRVHWDRLREPSFASRWNPFTTDMPFITFIPHPVQTLCSAYGSICNMTAFRDVLQDAAQEAGRATPVPGRANGVLLLRQALEVDALVGAMAGFGNTNKLGYSMARGNLGF